MLEAHYREHRNKLAKIASYRVKDFTLGEDVVQEAYAKALRYLDKYNPEYEFGGWFHRIFNNTVINVQRIERDGGVVKDDDLSVPHAGDDYLAKKEIASLIQGEKPKHRDLLHMFFFEGFNARQIADFLGISHGSVRLIIYRFRDKVAIPAGDS